MAAAELSLRHGAARVRLLRLAVDHHRGLVRFASRGRQGAQQVQRTVAAN